jgi:RNA-directed DNA polymerase
MRSWSAKCLAVRKVTQENTGKKTAGVDGVKSLTPKQRLELVKSLKITQKSQPTRRVWIPQPGTTEKRGLGIPCMTDRALQALVKLALEPEWEARFEPNSYGFRPGRSCHDAIEAIFTVIAKKAKFVLDADIGKCFDRISHEKLLLKLNTFPTISRQVRAWLKAGVMDGKTLFPTSSGTPQGGVLSPLLANIALHGMENQISQVNKNARLIRFADDFVIIHENESIVTRCQQVIAEWLSGMGLELNPNKTHLTHTLDEYESKVGFDFLGFTIRQFPVGKYRSAKIGGKISQPLGFKTIITPSKKKLKLHTEHIGSIINTHESAPQMALIDHLNPVIRGWANYYSTVVSKETYSQAETITYQQLRAWAKRRHPNKTSGWIAQKY